MNRSVHTACLAGIVLLAGCNTPPPGETAAQPALVEYIEGALDEERGHYRATLIDGHLRYIHETLESPTLLSAENHYYFTDDQLMYYTTSANWQTADNTYRIGGWAEYGLAGTVLGMQKTLDETHVPVEPQEPLDILRYAQALLVQIESSGAASNPCDQSKSLRWRDWLLTVSATTTADCGSTRLRVYAQGDGHAHAFDALQSGFVREIWLDDFDNDGKAELVLAMNDSLLVWRLENQRLLPLGIPAPPVPVQDDANALPAFFTHGRKIVFRLPLTDANGLLTGWQRWQLDFAASRWTPEIVESRNRLFDPLRGEWQADDHSFALDPDGRIAGKYGCDRFVTRGLVFPGQLLHVEEPLASTASCPDGESRRAQINALDGAWYFERHGEQLRLVSLNTPQTLEFARPGSNSSN